MYQVDWTSQHVPNWRRYLGRFIGKPCYGLEIGCYEGRSTLWFCENILTHNTAMLTCVDPFDPAVQVKEHIKEAPLQRFLENVKPVFRKIMLCNQTSSAFWARGSGAMYDWEYIDGSHEMVHTACDMVMGFELLKTGGIMIIDDYMESLPLGVTDPETGKLFVYPVHDAVNNFIEVYDNKIQVHELGFQAILEKK